MGTGLRRTRAILFASVSVIAISAVSVDVRAADLGPRPAVIAKAPAPIVKDEWTLWVEGGAFGTGGTSLFTPIVLAPTGDPKWGWDAAIGVDYKFGGTPWHASAQFRYAKAGKRSGNFSIVGTSGAPPFYTTAVAAGPQEHKEKHWVADFAVGRDFGLGGGITQIKLGVRIAELHAKTTASGVFTTYSYGAYPFAAEQKSRFLGAGPRLGIDGSIPLGGAWSFDYLGGVAVLYGTRTLDVSISWPDFTGTVSASDTAAIFNADAQAGISYAVTPNFKLTGSYRFDGYWGALKSFDASGNSVNADRFFHGPSVKASLKF